MRRELLGLLQCDSCRQSDWSTTIEKESASEWLSGSVTCRACGHVYRLVEGVLDCLGSVPVEDDESEGWMAFAGKEGWNAADVDYLNSLPFGRAKTLMPKDTLTWDRHCRNFFRTLSYVDLNGKRVLDLGAGRCWSTKYLALQGAQCVATDIVMPSPVGLQTAAHYLQTLPIYFERVRSDWAHLPFRDGAFDVVWGQGSIHHSMNLPHTLGEIARVLTPGGLLVFTNESCERPDAAESRRMPDMPGIHEHNYRAYRQYLWLRKAGFRKVEIIPDVRFLQTTDYCYHRLARLSAIHPVFVKLKLLLRGGVFNMVATKR